MINTEETLMKNEHQCVACDDLMMLAKTQKENGKS